MKNTIHLIDWIGESQKFHVGNFEFMLYKCRKTVIPNILKLTTDPKKVTCKNCKRWFIDK